MYKEAVHSFIGKLPPDGKSPDDSRPKSSWRSSLGTLSGATLLAFLARLLCPACWPTYAGLMSSMGLGFLLKTAWLLPLTMITLAFVIGSLAFRARARRGYGPFILGLLGSGALLGGYFVFTSGTAISVWGIDGGAALLVVASIWNGWPRKRKGMEVSWTIHKYARAFACSLLRKGIYSRIHVPAGTHHPQKTPLQINALRNHHADS